MTRLVVLALMVLAGTCYARNIRIVGGEETTVEKYPSIVQIDFSNNFGFWTQSCGGNILNELFILSAAHCFDGVQPNPNRRRIRAGATYRNTGGIIVGIVIVHRHPEYRVVERFDADIAVFRLERFLQFSASIQPSPIPPQGAVIADNLPVVHAGWGATEFRGPASPVLLDAHMYTINREICHERHLQATLPEVVTTNMICTGLLDIGGRSPCNGDSGGPLFYAGITIGVISWGEECGTAKFPGVNAAVSSYTDWIFQTASG